MATKQTMADAGDRLRPNVALGSDFPPPARDSADSLSEDSINRLGLAEKLQRTREALARSEERYRALTEQAPVMMHSIGRNGRIVRVSDLWLATLGYRREEVVGRCSTDFLTEASRRYAAEVVLPDYMRTGVCRDVPYEFVRRDGEIIDVLLSATAERNHAGEIMRSIAVLTNVSERKRAEAQLRFSEARLRALADNTPLVIFMKDLAGRYVVINREFERAHGWSEAEMLGKTAYDILPPESAGYHTQHDREAIESGKTIRHEFVTGAPDDPQTWSGIKFPIINSAGTTIGVGCVESNVTSEKRAEESLRRAKEQAEAASGAKSEFLASISHELRTPLNAIIGFSELMRNETFGSLSTRYRGYAQDIYYSGSLLLDLINDILDLSKIEAKRYELREEAVEIGELVSAALRMTSERALENGIGVEQTIAANVPRLFVDPRLVLQILLNLLSNAIKFTPRGGRIIVSVDLLDDGDIAIEVCDTGIGIEPHDLSKAMEAFGQVESPLARKHGGTGLGLPLAKGLAELHGGKLNIDSKVNEGTTAVVRLPACRLLPD